MNNNEVVARRLSQLRSELASPGEEAWSQQRLADEAGLTLNIVHRLEQSCAGRIEAMFTLLTFYHNRGYNISWIILDDNSAVSKYLLNDAKAVDTQFVLNKLEELRASIVSQ
jgi:hypothetical protein